MTKTPGSYMAAELDEAPTVFARAATQDLSASFDGTVLGNARAIYTVARGSSDAAANILSYEFMRQLGVPVTSLPPSVFSLGRGVAMDRAGAVVISQSGASDDLVRTARGMTAAGASVVAITNQSGSAVEAEAQLTVSIGAGEERAVPATKTVIGSVAAGMALLGALRPDYAAAAKHDAKVITQLGGTTHTRADDLRAALLRARHVYVIGRDTGFGAAHEVALKIKETCAIHAEAYSSSEVLHGPLQLATNPLLVLMLDTGQAHIQDSLDTAQTRFEAQGVTVMRLRPSDVGAAGLTGAAAAALMLYLMYPVILNTALALGLDPDQQQTLSKVTQTT